MSYLDIALSGLTAARQALTIVGDNIANVATEGYHRKVPIFSSVGSFTADGTSIGQGVRLQDVHRISDRLIEDAILRSVSTVAGATREAEILRSLESVLGEPADGRLSDLLLDFFSAWNALSLDPASTPLRDGVVQSANLLAQHLNFLADSVSQLRAGLYTDALQVTDEINSLSSEIARLNVEIKSIEAGGGAATGLLDQRDALLARLAENVDIRLVYRDFGVVDVQCENALLVAGGASTTLHASLTAGGDLSVRLGDPMGPDLLNPGGTLQALLSLQNDILPGVLDDFDQLARSLITAVNEIHAQGVGMDGAFTSLQGRRVTGALADLVPPLTSGNLYIRVTDQATGQTNRYAVSIDPAADDLASIAAKLDALAGVAAFVADNRLSIQADAGYTFDFLPALDAEPDPAAITGSARPTMSGSYTGPDNDQWTFTVSGSGQIGVDDDLTVEVRNAASELVAVVSLGADYPPGTIVDVAEGVRIAFSSGSLNDGDTFTVDVFASTDTASVLSALGLNTFFEGASAATMRVNPAIGNDPSLLAAALDPVAGDNTNARRIADMMNQSFDDLLDQSMSEFASGVASRVAQVLFLRDNQRHAEETFLSSLRQQRDQISGVDMDTEALKLLEFQRMYEGMAKYLIASDEAMQSLMELIR